VFFAWADVRPDERRSATAAFLTLLGLLASHTLLETARDALFLSRLPATQLPWMYLALAAAAFPAARGRIPRALGLHGPRGFPLQLLLCAGVTLVFWLFRKAPGTAGLYLLYVWSGLFGTLSAVRFWSVVSEMYTVTQAKRLFRLIGIGSVLGATLGALLGGLIAARYPARTLLLASAAVALVTALGPARRLRVAVERHDEGQSLSGVSLASAFTLIREHPYVRPLAGLVLTSTVAVTLADYLFKSAVARSVPASELGFFFSLTYAVLNLVAFAVQVLCVGALLGRLGVHRSLALFPLLLVAGAFGFIATGGLAAALLLKGADGALRYTLHRTGTELLYVPLNDAIRARVKPFIDAAGQRGGQALASVLILTPVAFLPRESFLALCLAGVALLWVLTVVDLKQNYLDLFRSALKEGAIATRSDLPSLDLASLEALFAALNSRDDDEVLAAMDLLRAQGKARLIPALVLYHPSATIVTRALALFVAEGRSDFLPIADRLLSHPDPEIRAAALRARTIVQPDQEILQRMSRDTSARVRATAAVGLVAGGFFSDEAQRVIDQLLASQSPAAARALAQAIQQQPNPVFEPVLLDLADAPESDVLVAVAGAMEAMPSPRFLPALLPMLSQREARGAARAAFLAHGAAGLRFLDEALDDYKLPQEIRRHLPRTISPFPPEQAAPILLQHLVRERDGLVRFKILRGVGRIRANDPDLHLDQQIVGDAIRRTVEGTFRMLHWRQVLEEGARRQPARRGSGFELLTTLLRDKEVHGVERLFRLLGLQFPREDVRRIYRGFRSGNAKIRASSRELMENLLPQPLGRAVLALADPVPGEDQLAAAGPYYAVPPLIYEDLLAVMLEEASESLRSLAAYHVAELGLVSLRPRLQALAPAESAFFVARVLERAVMALGGTETRRV
jgi:AAA family ATP:ADP antiporter